MTIYEEPEVLAVKSQIVAESRSALTAAQRAADEGLVNLQMALFCSKYVGIADCVATRKILDQELRKFAVETLEPGQFYRFTSVNLELLVSKKPEVLEMLAPRPSSEPRQNSIEADKKLRSELIKALIDAGVSKQYLEPNEKTGLRWVDSHSTGALQQLLANIESRRKFELMDRGTLRQEARTAQANLAKRHGTHEPLPVSYDLVKKDFWGKETSTTYQLDGPGLKKLMIAMTPEQLRKFQSTYGVEAINARMIGGK